MKNKRNVIIFVVILIIILITSIVLGKSNHSKSYSIEDITNVEYVVFQNDNKYGVIDRSGKILVDAVYDEIDIPNPMKPVFICKYDYNVEKQEYNIKVLNEKNETILYQYFIVEAIKLDWDNSEVPFEKSVLKYKQKGKYGIIDFNGKAITKAKYDEIKSLDFQEGLLLVKKNDKYGVINIKGDYILKERYDIIKPNENYQASKQIDNIGFIVGNLTSDGYKYGYVNYKNQKVLNIEYDQIEIVNKNEEVSTYFIAFKDGKAGFYNNKYNILKNLYDNIIYNEYNNCLIIEKDGKQGVFKVNGEMILPIEYDNIFMSGRYVNTRKEEDVEVFDYTDMSKVDIKNIIGLNETLENDKYIIAISSNEKYKIINVTDNMSESSNEYDYLEYIGENVFIAYKEGRFGAISETENLIIDFKYDDMQKIQNDKIIRAIYKDGKTSNIKYFDYAGKEINYSDNNSLYLDEIGDYKKLDLGYGQLYYIKK